MEASLAVSQMQNEAADGQLTLEQQLQQQSKMMAALTQLESRSINMSIADEGELKAVVDSFLTAQGMTHEQFKQVVAMQLQQVPVSEELATAISNFVNGLSSFSVSAKLPEGTPPTAAATTAAIINFFILFPLIGVIFLSVYQIVFSLLTTIVHAPFSPA